MNTDYLNMTLHLIGAIIAGGLIGLERDYHDKPAGFRTHTLVCLSSSVLMLISLYPSHWVPQGTAFTIQTDPTRMAQGIMTGIGFLGAGVIYKENLSVRGLTTAASIWITAAIGILFGVGFYFPAILATLFALGILTIFRQIENKIPSLSYVLHYIRFDHDNVMSEDAFRDLLKEHSFAVSGLGYQVGNEGRSFEYQAILRTKKPDAAARLVTSLRSQNAVRSFHLAPIGD
tara:strand:- start:57896 stop:58588 length:693 start_codon:yes stop_codon:yes gene_type:complete